MEDITTCEDNLIYHYTSADTAIKYILFTNKLRLSPLKMMNDPKESKFPVIPWIPSSNLEPVINKNAIIRSMIENHTKAICFSQDRLVDNEIIKGYDLTTMWAHYGDNHKGVCLGFDKDIIYDSLCSIVSDENLVHGIVRYDNNIDNEITRIRVFTQDDFKCDTPKEIYNEYKRYFFRKITQFHFTKRLDWDSEQEYKFIVCEEDNSYMYFDFGNALKQIILGSDMNYKSKDYFDFKQYELKYGINISQINWNFGRGRLIGTV